MTSYNYSDPEGNAILIFAGVMLPKEAKHTNGGFAPLSVLIAGGRGDKSHRKNAHMRH